MVGGPTAVLQIGGLRLLAPPTFSPAGVLETRPGRPLTKTEDPATAFAAIRPVDTILLSHDQHADNLDPAGIEGSHHPADSRDARGASIPLTGRDRPKSSRSCRPPSTEARQGHAPSDYWVLQRTGNVVSDALAECSRKRH